MAKRNHINIDKYRLGKNASLRTNNPYRLGSPYHPLSDPYKILEKLLRGYKKSAKARSYSPSGRKGGSSSAPRNRSRTAYRPKMRYQPQPPYKPQPTPRAVRSSDRPWTEPPKSKLQPIRYEPDLEKMLKQLEKKFDEKLEQEVLERMDTEFEELKAALAEMSEASSSAQKKIEAGPEEEAQDQLETTELIGIDNQRTSTEAQAELPIRDSSYDVEEKIEWLREQVDDEESIEPNGQIEEMRQASTLPTLDMALEPIEPIETDQVTEQHASELNEALNEIAPIEIGEVQQDLESIGTTEPIPEPVMDQMMGDAASTEPLSFEPIDLLEQSADLEQIFEQIEPLESELMEPIEAIPGFPPEILPEPLEEAVGADAMEAGYY